MSAIDDANTALATARTQVERHAALVALRRAVDEELVYSAMAANRFQVIEQGTERVLMAVGTEAQLNRWFDAHPYAEETHRFVNRDGVIEVEIVR